MSETPAARSEVLEPGPGRVLVFAPHPDDEVLGVGGTLCRHGAAGADVRVVIATDGRAGDPEGRFPGDYAGRRREESRAAMRVLGLPEPSFWGLPDSCVVVEADKVRLERMVCEEVANGAPDVVYLPWALDNHRDHLVLHEVVVRGLRLAGFAGDARGFEVWAPIPIPDLVVDITEVRERKAAALACYETQFAYGDLGHQVFGMNAYRSLILQRDRAFGEAFQRVGL